VAGIELAGKRRVGWIRPVSAREHEEVSEYERQYEDGSDPRHLDVIDVPLLEPRPKLHQQENWLLDPDQYWRKAGQLEWDDLSSVTDPVGPLWIDGDSTRNGMNDRISLPRAAEMGGSLRLVHADTLTLVVYSPGEEYGDPKRRVQGHFRHAGVQYRLWVTDPAYERAYKAKPDGEYRVGENYLTISLAEPHKGACYKVIAAILERDGAPKS
jgi:hypothetical protein